MFPIVGMAREVELRKDKGGKTGGQWPSIYYGIRVSFQSLLSTGAIETELACGGSVHWDPGAPKAKVMQLPVARLKLRLHLHCILASSWLGGSHFNK